MRACVIFDTRYGNTEKIAESFETGLKEAGIQTVSVNANDVAVDSLKQYDLICVGAPTEAFTAYKPMKEFLEKLKMPVSEMELSVRSANCLEKAKIKTLGDLVHRSESEMLKYRNFGKKSLAEINKILVGMGLSLGMKFEEEPKTKEESE